MIIMMWAAPNGNKHKTWKHTNDSICLTREYNQGEVHISKDPAVAHNWDITAGKRKCPHHSWINMEQNSTKLLHLTGPCFYAQLSVCLAFLTAWFPGNFRQLNSLDFVYLFKQSIWFMNDLWAARVTVVLSCDHHLQISDSLVSAPCQTNFGLSIWNLGSILPAFVTIDKDNYTHHLSNEV